MMIDLNTLVYLHDAHEAAAAAELEACHAYIAAGQPKTGPAADAFEEAASASIAAWNAYKAALAENSKQPEGAA